MNRSPHLVNQAFRTFAVSTILAVMATSLGVVVNGIIVGNMMGSAELSAVNLVSPLIQLYNAVTALVCVGGATLCAVLVGKGINGDTGKVFTASMIMLVLFSVILAAMGVMATGAVVDVLCSDVTLRPLVQDYARIALMGAAVYLFLPGLAMFVRVDGSPRAATAALVTANVISPMLCIVLVHSGMGLEGASAAVVIGYAIGTVMLIAHMFRNRSTTLFRPAPGGSVHIPHILMYGAPVALASVMMVAKMLFMNTLTLENLGTAGMAIMAVAMNVLMLASMLIGGTCQTVQPIGGTLYGSEDMDGISYLTRTVSKVLLISLTAIVLLVIAFPGFFCDLFGVTDPGIRDQAVTALRLFSPCILLYGVNYAIMIMFQVLGHKSMAVVVSVVQPLAVMVTAALLVGVEAELLWASFWIGELIVLSAIAVTSAVMRRRDPGLQGFLLGRRPTVPMMSMSVKGDLSDMGSSLDSIGRFLTDNGVCDVRRDRALLCLEELASNVSQHGLGSDPGRCMDVVVRVDSDPSIVLRDDGAMFNPMTFDGSGMGIQIAKGMCTSMSYSRAMGQNNVRFTF